LVFHTKASSFGLFGSNQYGDDSTAKQVPSQFPSENKLSKSYLEVGGGVGGGGGGGCGGGGGGGDDDVFK
jgi:hypothetical protein